MKKKQNLNRLTASSETDFVIQTSKQKSPANKCPGLDSFTGEVYRKKKKKKANV